MPVIASRFPSLAFVETENLGVLVRHPAGNIADAIGAISNAYSCYKENCLSYSARHFSYDHGWSRFEQAFNSMIS